MYSDPLEQYAMRHFSGFYGTPISYRSEEPRTEDLNDLEELGLGLGDSDGDQMDIEPVLAPNTERQLIGQEFSGIPWFDTMKRNLRLGNMRITKGMQQSRDGTVRVEWEMTEWTSEDDDAAESSVTHKRRRSQEGGTAASAPSAG